MLQRGAGAAWKTYLEKLAVVTKQHHGQSLHRFNIQSGQMSNPYLKEEPWTNASEDRTIRQEIHSAASRGSTLRSECQWA